MGYIEFDTLCDLSSLKKNVTPQAPQKPKMSLTFLPTCQSAKTRQHTPNIKVKCGSNTKNKTKIKVQSPVLTKPRRITMTKKLSLLQQVINNIINSKCGWNREDVPLIPSLQAKHPNQASGKITGGENNLSKQTAWTCHSNYNLIRHRFNHRRIPVIIINKRFLIKLLIQQNFHNEVKDMIYNK